MAEGRFRAFAINVGLAVASLVISVVGVEIGLRLYGYSAPSWHLLDSELGWRNIPGSAGWFWREGIAYVRMNHRGFNSRHEFSIDKPPRVTRIAVIGDSQVAALQVAQDEHFAHVAETEIARCPDFKGRSVEVYPFGVQGYSTVQELLLYRTVVRQFRPDAVVLGVYLVNDVYDNTEEGAGGMAPFARLTDAGVAIETAHMKTESFQQQMRSVANRAAVINSSRILQMAKEASLQVSARTGSLRAQGGRASDENIFEKRFSEENWRLFTALVQTLAAEVRRDGASFYTMRLDPLTSAALNERLETELGTVSAPHIAAASQLAKVAREKGIDFYAHNNARIEGGHFNAAGHAIVGRMLGQALCTGQ